MVSIMGLVDHNQRIEEWRQWYQPQATRPRRGRVSPISLGRRAGTPGGLGPGGCPYPDDYSCNIPLTPHTKPSHYTMRYNLDPSYLAINLNIA